VTTTPRGDGANVWRWIATRTRCHLALTHRHLDGVVRVAYDLDQPKRFRTRCGLGPFEGTKLYHVGPLSPPECRACMKLWSATMRRLTLDDHTRGEVAP